MKERSYMPRNKKTVVIFMPGGGAIEVGLLAGVQDMAKTLRWELSIAECLRRRDGALKFIRSPGGGTVAEVLESVRPDGILVANNAVEPDELLGHGPRMLPAVFIDRPAQDSVKGGAAPVCVFSEASSYARLAAEELFRSDFSDYAFLPWPDNPSWSRERGECFKRLITEAGKRFHPFQSPRGAGAADLVAHLASFLESLPKPCGVFAANDGLGEAALRVCAMHGWAVPQTMAVVGVDNLDFICETTEPPLSSISRNLANEGRAAAELLAECMDKPRARRTSRAMPALRVVRRASSFVASDRRIARALEHIRLHACETDFAPPQVVAATGLSRSQADLLFRHVIGRSILDAIHDARLAHAQDLLRAGKTAAFVADTCGYASLVDFRRVFKHRVGKTVRTWTLEARR